MTDKEMNIIAEWLISQGYEIDLKDPLWMEDIFDMKLRDVIDYLNDYHKSKILISTYKLINLIEGLDVMYEDKLTKISEVHDNGNVTIYNPDYVECNCYYEDGCACNYYLTVSLSELKQVDVEEIMEELQKTKDDFNSFVAETNL